MPSVTDETDSGAVRYRPQSSVVTPFTEILVFDERLDALALDGASAVTQGCLTDDCYVRVMLLPLEE